MFLGQPRRNFGFGSRQSRVPKSENILLVRRMKGDGPEPMGSTLTSCATGPSAADRHNPRTTCLIGILLKAGHVQRSLGGRPIDAQPVAQLWLLTVHTVRAVTRNTIAGGSNLIDLSPFALWMPDRARCLTNFRGRHRTKMLSCARCTGGADRKPDKRPPWNRDQPAKRPERLQCQTWSCE